MMPKLFSALLLIAFACPQLYADAMLSPYDACTAQRQQLVQGYKRSSDAGISDACKQAVHDAVACCNGNSNDCALPSVLSKTGGGDKAAGNKFAAGNTEFAKQLNTNNALCEDRDLKAHKACQTPGPGNTEEEQAKNSEKRKILPYQNAVEELRACLNAASTQATGRVPASNATAGAAKSYTAEEIVNALKPRN